MNREPAPPSEASPGDASNRRLGTRRRPRPGAALIAGGVLLVGLALAAVGPAYRQLERWRAQTLVSQGAELTRQQLFADAISRYQAALRLVPDQAKALRGLADIYSLFEKPAALPAWRALLALPAASEQDALDFIEFTLRVQRFDLAESELSRLLAGTNVTIPTRVLAAEYYRRQGDTRRALAFAEDILRTQPDQPAHQLRLVRALLAMPEADRQREGLARLAALPPLSPQDRLAVLQTLEAAPSLPLQETRAFLETLPPLTPATATDLLAQTDVRLRLSSDAAAREPWIQSAIHALRAGSPEDQVALCRWLHRIREPARLLDQYSLADATALPPILPAYLDALGQTQRWQDLQQAVSTTLPLDPWILAAFRAAAASRLAQNALAQEQWRRAFEAAHEDPTRLLAVGDVALRQGVREKAIEAYTLLTHDDLNRTSGYRRLAKVYEESRDAERLRLLMKEWSANAPEDPNPDATYAYLCALVRRNLDDAHGRASRLVENHPARVAYRTTLAFLEWRREQPRAALQLLQRARTDPGTSPQLRLVHAVVLDANGQTAAARDIARTIPSENLFPEEQSLLRKVDPR